MNSNQQHDFHGQGQDTGPGSGEPTLAERARSLMAVGGTSTLATMSRKHEGYPYASVMPYALDAVGAPLFLMSQMAVHTKNVRSEPRATLLVAEQSDSPLGAARISLMGKITSVSEEAQPDIAAAYLARHPESRHWASFGDFAFYRMQISDVYFIGGFGVMGWIDVDDYAAAEPDPLATAAATIMAHMNKDHVEAMVLLAKHQLGEAASDARMTAIDRYGFNVALHTDAGVRPGRIQFPTAIDSPAATRKVFVDMVKTARAAT